MMATSTGGLNGVAMNVDDGSILQINGEGTFFAVCQQHFIGAAVAAVVVVAAGLFALLASPSPPPTAALNATTICTCLVNNGAAIHCRRRPALPILASSSKARKSKRGFGIWVPRARAEIDTTGLGQLREGGRDPNHEIVFSCVAKYPGGLPPSPRSDNHPPISA